MDVGTNIKPHSQGRLGATGLHWPFAAKDAPTHIDVSKLDVSAHHEIFKKTPFVAGLHSVSRDVVKDIPEIDSIPLLTTTLLDQDGPQGFVGRMITENPTTVTLHSHQGVLRSADEWTAVAGDVVGVTGNQVIDTSFTVTARDAGISNGKLTDRGWDARTSSVAARATNTGSGILKTSALPNQFASAGASLWGGDLENHSYADV